MPVTVATLRALGEALVDVHGQHDGRALLDPDRQRGGLDAHGGLGPKLGAYRAARRRHADLRRQRLDLIRAADDRHRERALLAFERDELAAAEPRADEFDELSRLARRLGGAERLRAAVAEGYALLYEADRSAQGLLERAARLLEPLGEDAPELADAAGELDRLADDTARSPMPCAGSAATSATSPPGSTPSRPAWRPIAAWQPASPARPTNWPIAAISPKTASPGSTATRPTSPRWTPRSPPPGMS